MVLAAAPSALARGNVLVPTIAFRPAARANYTVAHRPPSAIRLIVIHVTESSADGAIAWFENPHADASANYVVSQSGQITEMVPDTDIAWQAGNWAINRESIGIEHAGYTYRRGSFTDAEYRASAQLVGFELRRYLLPIDRRHVIGHSQVPDPNHPGLFGGFAHHTDPGPYWDWTRYMAYVRAYATGNTPPPHFAAQPAATAPATPRPSISAQVDRNGRVAVSSSGLADGETVAGFVHWEANVADPSSVASVEFYVDGRLRWTEHDAPYVFDGDGGSWDTTRETNGPHVLTVRVVTRGGHSAGQSLRVVVANSPFSVSLAGLANGQAVHGSVDWQAVPANAPVDHVDFLVDGVVRHTEHAAPYTFDGWDTTSLPNGAHTLTVQAVSNDGRIAEASVAVVVQNQAPPPPPPAARPAPIAIVMTGVWEGKHVSGRVDWEATVTGGTPDRVEFWIDGRLRWVEHRAPYVFDGDGNTWDASAEAPGPHVLNVRAVRDDGLIYDQQTFTVVVDAPAPPPAPAPEPAPAPVPAPLPAPAPAPAPAPLTLASSIADGATVAGTVTWTATVGGRTPERVDYFVDGRLEHTEREVPYQYAWDTTREQNGTHLLVVRATADGQVASATSTVTVANAAATPAPPTAPSVAVASQSLADGETISGTVTWTVTTTGDVQRVDFFVDDRWIWTEREAPYEFGGNGLLNSPALADGQHRLGVRVVGADGSVATAEITVTVANGDGG